MTGTEVPHAPHVAVSASPWPGSISIWSSVGDSGFELNRLLAAPSIIGVTETPLDPASPGRWDRGLPLRIRIVGGRLESAALEDVLNGRNSLAIGDGSTGNWEILQYSKADLVGPDTYEIGLRLRGQLGTAETMPPVWPVGSTVVVLDRSLTQLDLAPSARGLVRAYKVGPTARGYDDPVVVTRVHAFDGIGLRPYSVSHLRASGRAGAPVRATWIRRTRIDGDSWAALEVPLGEESESYLVRILKGESIRKEYVVSTPVFDYTAQAQGNDGVSGAFSLAVAQISGRFGPGPFRRIDIAA